MEDAQEKMARLLADLRRAVLEAELRRGQPARQRPRRPAKPA